MQNPVFVTWLHLKFLIDIHTPLITPNRVPVDARYGETINLDSPLPIQRPINCDLRAVCGALEQKLLPQNHPAHENEHAHYRYYKSFSEELVKQGYIVYAPQNPYRGGDKFRQLQRMSNPLQRSLFSYIIAQHEQTLDWLATLPQVDSTRIAFYGLSYGGKTAMRVPPLVEKYSLSICSGDFTDWPRTMASNNEKFSYLFTSEYEVFEWNLAHVARAVPF